jgi:hypothetical protein
MFIEELKNMDLNRKQDTCARMIWTFDTIPKRGRSSLVMNVPYTEAVFHGTLRSGPRRIQNILKKWNTIPHTS